MDELTAMSIADGVKDYSEDQLGAALRDKLEANTAYFREAIQAYPGKVAVVASGDRLVGIISMADLAREADVDERLQEAFEEISAERSFWSKMR